MRSDWLTETHSVRRSSPHLAPDDADGVEPQPCLDVSQLQVFDPVLAPAVAVRHQLDRGGEVQSRLLCSASFGRDRVNVKCGCEYYSFLVICDKGLVMCLVFAPKKFMAICV